MHFKIRFLSENTFKDIMVNMPRTAKVRKLRLLIKSELKIPVESQKLYFSGKRLTPKDTLNDCGINYSDVVHLSVQKYPKDVSNSLQSPSKSELKLIEAENQFYRVGDLIEVFDNDFGAWWDAKITGIFLDSDSENETFFFRAHYEWNDPSYTTDYRFDEIRPRSYHTYKRSELKKEMVVLANYNLEEPKKRGYWYDFQIEKLGKKRVTGTISIGVSRQTVANCTIKFIKEIMRIERPCFSTKRKINKDIPPKILPFYCDTCRDQGSLCFNCGCFNCGGKNDEASILLCDECDDGYHLNCLNPPLVAVPTEAEWFCPECKNPEMKDEAHVLQLNDENDEDESSDENSKKLANGMNCVSRTKICTIVPINHFGPIPGIEVGTCWKFRIQVSEAGVHRPTMAGIHGTSKEGAYSLVLSGGYEDDEDYGDEFLYTGSGGRKKLKKGEKLSNRQTVDQVLSRSNQALALNCNAKLNRKLGAKAENWQSGKPVRVVRNYRAGKHSKFAPKDGNRYDGIYKVVEYFPKKGKSGFIVWTFRLRRDDQEPAPWTQDGHDFPIIYPLGYLESQSSTTNRNDNKDRSKKHKVKRLLTFREKYLGARPKKKPKPKPFTLSGEIQRRIKADVVNFKLWDECLKLVEVGRAEFFSKIQECFTCVCCQELLFQPVTTKCNHNMCKQCLARSISLGMYTCPCCRTYLGKKRKLPINKNLQTALTFLFRGYDKYRE